MNSIKLPDIDELIEKSLDKALFLMQNNYLHDADILLQQLLKVDKLNARGMQLLGLIKHKQKEYGDAIALFVKILQIDPSNAENHNNISLAYACMGFIDKAIDHANKATELNPNNSYYYSNLGLHYRQKNNIPKAIECFEKSIAIEPNYYAWTNIGSIYGFLKDLSKAESCFKEAIALNPEHHPSYVDLAHVYFLQGKYNDAWPLYEHRLEFFPPALAFRKVYPDAKRWDFVCKFDDNLYKKQNLKNKKLALYCEQGIGDFIQFFRFASLLKDVSLCIHTPAGLQSLIRQNTTAEIKDVFKPEEYDYHCSMISLPHLFGGGSLDYLFGNSTPPYLRCEKKANLSNYSELKIGIAWAGNPQHPGDRARSCNLEHFKKIQAIPNVKLFGLQKETGPRKYAGDNQATDLTINCEGMGIIDLSQHIESFEDTAAFIDAMDLIISVDTAILHLAGAMGKKTWAVLPYSPDWRWGTDGDTTRWYPSMRLYRQTNPSNWGEVFDRMAQDLC